MAVVHPTRTKYPLESFTNFDGHEGEMGHGERMDVVAELWD